MKLRVRHDKNVIALFNPDNGAKVRLGLGRYAKASRPELVDIKITDYCAFNCAFCYQASTVNGKHAHWTHLRHIACQLAEAKVFEVALGGGEPTDHPDFIRLLRYFRALGIVPNYTTKSLHWTKHHWDEVKSLVGAFAFSAETVQDLHSAAQQFADIPRDRINIHYVMGLQTREEFIDFMTTARTLGFRVTLLGYKTVGRGDEVEHTTYDWWLDAVRHLQEVDCCPTFSIDTPLAEQYEQQLLAFLPSYTFHTREGAFSMYIDAVAMKMGASSFDANATLVPFDEHWRQRYKEL